eukprot:jgi/Orpsp1_1/1190587/evm.model.d7180000079960.1
MLTATNFDEESNIPSYNVEKDIQREESEEQIDISEEDISEIEEFLAKDDIDPDDLKSKANKLIQLIKVKERDLLLAAQIGQSLLDANVSMQNQLKMISENQKIDVDNQNNSEVNEDDDYYGTYSQSPMAMNPRNTSSVRFDEPIPNSNSMRNASIGKKPLVRSDSYDINTYTDNLEEVNYKLQNQVEKLEESLKQNEQQNSKRIVLLENLLEQLQGELSELQNMNRDLENEKRLLIKEKESSKKINEMSEKDAEKMIAQLYDNKNKLVDTVNKLETAQMNLKRRSAMNLDIDELDFGLVQSQEQLNDKMKLSEELDDSQGESSHSRRVHRRRVIRRSTLGEEADIEEEEIEEHHSSRSNGHHRHHRHSHLRHIQPLTYDNENDFCTVTPTHSDDNVVVLHGRISNIDEEDEEDMAGPESRELVLRDKPCHKCGKIRLNRFNHPKNSRRSRSRVMRARAKRTDIKKKRYSALVPLKSTGEEDEETNSLIKLRDNSGFMGIYNTCKQAIEKLDYSKTDLTKSQSAWKFVQFWFAMLCIFIGCIVVSYRRVFHGTPPTKPVKKTIAK